MHYGIFVVTKHFADYWTNHSIVDYIHVVYSHNFSDIWKIMNLMLNGNVKNHYINTHSSNAYYIIVEHDKLDKFDIEIKDYWKLSDRSKNTYNLKKQEICIVKDGVLLNDVKEDEIYKTGRLTFEKNNITKTITISPKHQYIDGVSGENDEYIVYDRYKSKD